MANEQLQGAPYPVSTDAPDGPAQILALASWARLRVVQVYASAAARTAAFSAAVVTPTDGMVSYLQDTDLFEEYNGSSWAPWTESGAWTALTLPAGYTAVAGLHAPAYRRVRRRVHFRGACNIAASNAAGTKFTMPTGFRPTDGVTFAAPLSNGTAITDHLRYNVNTSGAMSTLIVSPAGTSLASFEGLSYAID